LVRTCGEGIESFLLCFKTIAKMNYRRPVGLLICTFFFTILSMAQTTGPTKADSSMQPYSFTPNGDLIVRPSAVSSPHDFDFIAGWHNVHHKILRSRLSNSKDFDEYDARQEMHLVLNGIGDIETHYLHKEDGSLLEGVALRLFNPSTRLWSIYWVNSDDGILQPPVTGSFDAGVGRFYGKDSYKGKPILVQYLWDARNVDRPVWQQAFSTDNGKTWEWNWYMYFSRSDGDGAASAAADGSADSSGSSDLIRSLELRNYVLRSGKRDVFIPYFENNFIGSQQDLGAHILGQYRVKGEDDHFFWLRGFGGMTTRSRYLPAFYYGPYWKAHRDTANAMLANNDNVNLLMPLVLRGDSLVSGPGVPVNSFRRNTGIAVVDFFVSNTKLDQLKKVFSGDYLSLLRRLGLTDYSLWVCEQGLNDFPRLPVFQDKNLLVMISYYPNEEAFEAKRSEIARSLTPKLKDDLDDAITIRHTLILYPTQATLQRWGLRTFPDPAVEGIKLSFQRDGGLRIVPSATSSKHDYDFLLGRGTVHHKVLHSRLSGETRWVESDGTRQTVAILRGLGNIESHSFTTADGARREGLALRLFRPKTRLWRLYWADSQHGTLDIAQIGSFSNGVGSFLAKDEFDGKPVIVRFQYDKRDPAKPTWGQAFSTDNGRTWEWNWFMYYNQ
jgi:hypothetical protein